MKGGFGKFIFIALIAFCVIGAASNFFGGSDSSGGYGYDFADGGDWYDSDESSGGSGFDESLGGSTGNQDGEIRYSLPKHRSMYNEISSGAKSIYAQLRDTVASGSLKTTFKGIKESEYDAFVKDLYAAYDAMYYDYPEFFWLNSGWQGNPEYSWSSGGYDMELEMYCYDYWTYTTNKSGYIDAVISEAERIANLAAAKENDYEKIKFVHDYLVVNAEYDYVCLEEINKTVQRASSQQSHSVYGALVNKVCVCDGYAKTFQLITYMLGINAPYVEGDAGGGHAWNYVVLDGNEYWMDVTWDENELEGDNGKLLAPNGANYSYFCADDDKLYKTHKPDSTFKIPVCDSTKYNFFYYEDSFLDSYDYDEVVEAVEEQKGAQIIHVKFKTESGLEQALDKLIYSGKYKNIPYFKNKDVQVYSSKNDNLLHFYLP